MKSLDETIKSLETDPVPMAYTARLSVHEDIMTDALEYLKEYRQQKCIWKKLYLLAHRMFWGLEEEYPLNGHSIENDLFDAYSEGFDDEDIR